MALILMNSSKGGVGNSFLTAQLALHLAGRGHDVTAIDFTYQDALKMHFGFAPEQRVPELGCEVSEGLVAFGISLKQGHAVARNEEFRERIAAGALIPTQPHAVTIVDVASEDRALIEILGAHCALHVCTLTPTASALATLPKLGEDRPVVAQDRMVFVLNQLDDRYRLSRHSTAFLRDILGEQLIARVRRDEAVNEALARFEPISKYAPHSATLPDLALFAAAVEVRLGLQADPEFGLVDAGGRL
jgi:cellulose biosynthesis protein BcsQ